ncbi:hypothetical protein FHQ18_07840 [Deferribacter autotrophicus]|uniref:DUF2281 domain-containing protein n=1 Tax=Deferribacter autotrophicus TaxID=500465 RepID=A0A5A8F736_9BACT|nr:hypothetical protein [Deferribacter autotrophicus]KAA0257646.1 hypothetical protein FHQ18_07840 [Deferribacter autotrophicus]
MKSVKQVIDLDILPEGAKKELFNFYELLLKKYKISKENKLTDDVDKFFEKYALNLDNFKFKREEIHER